MSVTDPRPPSRPRRLLILGICCLSLLIVHASLHASSGLQWTIDAYTLVLASLLMLAGQQRNRIGRRRVIQIGPITNTAVSSVARGAVPA